MNHWLLDSIKEKRIKALTMADKSQINQELLSTDIKVDFLLIREVSDALELAVLDILNSNPLKELDDNTELVGLLHKAAFDAFRLLRMIPLPDEPVEAGSLLLRASCLAMIGDRGADAARWLRLLGKGQWPVVQSETADWGTRTWICIINVWLMLIRKNGWEDRDNILLQVAELRQFQKQYEKEYLRDDPSPLAKAKALELIGLYHLAKGAEMLALFITNGEVEGNHQIQQLLDAHFDRVLAICSQIVLIELENATRLLVSAAKQMVNNSIWTVTRAVNSRVTRFVRTLVDRGRGDKAIFDVLPPQRRTLAEKGLLGSSRRAVVVSLPTSSGKTLIAQFRILQALNQFDDKEGWVAYLAPTRTLVNQIFRQMRRDFSPLNIIVERVSPALEIDSVEMKLLENQDQQSKFRVLVTTPEKLDLMLRQDMEKKIGRPLTLVVVDEAHNIQSSQRGLKLELLLATINNECQYAQFLLLTPFINNAREVSRWLGGQNSDDISIGIDWQPNDRVIGLVRANKGEKLNGLSYDYDLSFKPIHTTRDTLAVDDLLQFSKIDEFATTFAKANKKSTIAAIISQKLKKRGPVIVMHGTADWVWSLADRLKIETNRKENIHLDIKLVQDYLRMELGDNFPLIGLLEFGIAVHHSGLPEEVRTLVEWLFENEHLDFLVATTTIAQGVNFPVSGVVMASYQYFSSKGAEDMPAEDFWNIAGRAGRILQGQLGVVALTADSDENAEAIEAFIKQQTGDLNSALINMAILAEKELADLGKVFYKNPEWSSFLQYLAHTYRQMGNQDNFVAQIEQVLRGTFGFEKLRTQNSRIANILLDSVTKYADYISDHKQPLSLVDSTGFSLNSIITILTNKGNVGSDSWDVNTLFAQGDDKLKDMMGVLLRVPELRENLEDVIRGSSREGESLALIIKDWVGGKSIPDIARIYFNQENTDDVTAITHCGQKLFGKLTQTASWGLGALLSITGGNIAEDEYLRLRNIPSKVFYGVNSDEAIVMRLLGIPRLAADQMATLLNTDQPLDKIRIELASLQDSDWQRVLGEKGEIYRRVWRILEGEEGS
jgi:superfamily II DNA/RNA helicase